jgi:hypothetical protein
MAEVRPRRPWKPKDYLVLGLAVLVLGGVSLVGLRYVLDTRDDFHAEGVRTPDPAERATPEGPGPRGTIGDGAGALEDFREFVDSGDKGTGEAHEFAADGIRRFASLIDVVVDTRRLDGTNVMAKLDELRQRAARLDEGDADDPRHAQEAHDAFATAADAIDVLARQIPPADAAAATSGDVVQEAAASVRPDRPLSDQHQQVQQFFMAARDALTTIDRR